MSSYQRNHQSLVTPFSGSLASYMILLALITVQHIIYFCILVYRQSLQPKCKPHENVAFRQFGPLRSLTQSEGSRS